MNKKNTIHKLMEDFDIENEIQQEIKNLEGAKQNISVFFGVIFQNYDRSFGSLDEYKIDNLFGEILKFINSNSKKLKEEKENNLYISYFLEFFYYFIKYRNKGSLESFNFIKIYDLEFYTQEEKDFYFRTNLPNYITDLVFNIHNFIDDELEDLEDILVKDKPLITTNTSVNNQVTELLLNNSIKVNYISFFDDILNSLFLNKHTIIAQELEEKLLFDELEKLIYFIENNKEEILKQENGDKIFNFILGISRYAFEKNFLEYLEEKNIKAIEFIGLVDEFKKIVEKIKVVKNGF